MYKALYRKWRPQDFDTVCGQNHITNVLKYQIANGKFSHAYLFCGSRGTGKTSCAKIMAKAVNCEHPKDGNPCNECAACRSIDAGIATDVIEMDAASNNGVGDVRDIRDEVVFSPAELRFRVYIIDEVHMLSSSAFNALLKTLEEPPAHVIFILATTELQKLPNTIVSRCQRYDFRRLSTEVLSSRLKTIASAEGIELTDDGAFLISRMASGGMRDAISLFELCAGGGGVIDEKLASSILGVGNRGAIFEMIKSISAANYESIFESINRIMMHSGDLSVFWQELIDAYRDMMVVKTCKDARAYLDVTENEYETLKALAKAFPMETMVYHTKLLEGALPSIQKATLAKRSTAELTLIRLCEPRLSTDLTALLNRIAKLEEEISRLRLGIPVTPQAQAEVQTAPPPPTPTAPAKREVAKETDEYRALAYWSRLLDTLAERKPSVMGFFQKSMGYFSKEKGFLIKVSGDFAARFIGGEEISLMLKTLLSEFEGRNILKEPFNVISASSAASTAVSFIDELEELIGQND